MPEKWRVSNYSGACAGCGRVVEAFELHCVWWRPEFAGKGPIPIPALRSNTHCAKCWSDLYRAQSETAMNKTRRQYHPWRAIGDREYHPPWTRAHRRHFAAAMARRRLSLVKGTEKTALGK